MPQPAVHGVAGDVARDEKIDRRAGVGADGDGDDTLPKSKNLAGTQGEWSEGDGNHLQQHDQTRVGEHAEPAESRKFVV